MVEQQKLVKMEIGRTVNYRMQNSKMVIWCCKSELLNERNLTYTYTKLSYHLSDHVPTMLVKSWNLDANLPLTGDTEHYIITCPAGH